MGGVLRYLEVEPKLMTGPVTEWLRERRLHRGLSQAKVGKLAGVDEGTINRWESGKVKPTEKKLAIVRRALAD